MPSFLPREGLTLEASLVPLNLILFQPWLTGPLLLTLIYFPAHVANVLPTSVEEYAKSIVFISTLKYLFGFGLLRKMNELLSRLVLNNLNTDQWKFGEEIAVVTGGSSGIGAAIVRDLAKSSASVIVLDLFPSQDPLPSNAQFYKTDITSSTEISTVANLIRKNHGEPTVLINNAGISFNRTILDETEAQLRRIFDVNTLSHFLMVKEFLPAMIKQNHGHVVTVASMSSYVVAAQNVDYCCTKASALAFHEGLAQELKYRYGAPKVRTTMVNPGYVRTPLLADVLRETPCKHFVIEPETVADAIVAQLHSGMGGHLIVPLRFATGVMVRALPSWLQESIRNISSNDFAFLGKEGKQSPHNP